MKSFLLSFDFSCYFRSIVEFFLFLVEMNLFQVIGPPVWSVDIFGLIFCNSVILFFHMHMLWPINCHDLKHL